MIDVVPAATMPPGSTGLPKPGTAAEATGNLFALGRAAAAEARSRHEGRGVFCRSRQLLGTGAWRGPRDAADAYVEETDLAAAGGLEAAVTAGVRTLVLTGPSARLAQEAARAGLHCLVRLPFRAGEGAGDRQNRFDELQAFLRDHSTDNLVDGVIPTPQGEALGLDTVRVVARCRQSLPVSHVIVDFARLGHRLAQMCLGFGADELFGPIVAERALRLGDNANNPAMTRKEAATLLRGAGLAPHERLSSGLLEAVTS